MVRGMLENGFPPDEVARQVFEAVRDDKFYIFPAQDYMLEAVKNRMTGIIEQRNPTLGPLRA